MNKTKKKIKKKRNIPTAHRKKCIKNDNIIAECEKIVRIKCIQENKYDYLFEKILLNTNNLWLPDKMNYKNKPRKHNDKIINEKNQGTEYSSHSWFNITEYKPNKLNKVYDVDIKVPIIKDDMVKCEKIKMYPTELQRTLLLNWMYAYNRMYNETLKLFKKNRFNKTSMTLDWKRIRTDYLKDIKKEILNKSKINIKTNNKKKINTSVNGHILDFAIQDACAKYKSCLTNLRNGNIKYFRLRYLKQSKDTMVIKIEKAFINNKKNTFCSTVFQEAFNFQDNFQLKDIKCDFTIHYNRKTDEFQLLNPIKIKQEKPHNIRESASLDPGIRTFISIFSNSKCVKIGDNLIDRVLKYTKKIDKLNSEKCNKKPKIKKKLIRKYYKKINNIIDDLHWKTINYLTNNFGSVLVGNMSTKSIISNKLDNQLDDNIKRVAQHMSLYKFRQRLAYKCLQKSIGYIDIDEAYTTMTCTKCGYKNDVKKKKQIKCRLCKLNIDRDFAGARNIMLRGTDL